MIFPNVQHLEQPVDQPVLISSSACSICLRPATSGFRRLWREKKHVAQNYISLFLIIDQKKIIYVRK